MESIKQDVRSKMHLLREAPNLTTFHSAPNTSIDSTRRYLPVSEEFQFEQSDPFFSTNINVPGRFDAEIASCVIRGEMPKELDGTFYRVACDYMWAGRNQVDPKNKRDVWVNGDGAIDAWRFSNGVVDFKQKFVRTPRFLIERAARKPLFGSYRNPFSGDKRVVSEVYSPGNTHIHFWRGILLATKDDSPPIALDPDTLDTLGIYDFDGQLNSKTFTAHHKIDAVTGELIAFGMEASELGSNDLVYYVFDKHGNRREECWIKTPVVTWSHDFAVTDNYVVFMLMPFPVDIGADKATGEAHFRYSRLMPTYFGVIPRRNPKSDQVRWFTTLKNHTCAHFSNHFEDQDGVIYMDTFLTDGDGLGVFPDIHPELGASDPNRMVGKFVRFKIDPRSTTNEMELPVVLCGLKGEMARCDDRYTTKKYRHAFGASFGLDDFTGVVHVNVETGESEVWHAGEKMSVSEPCFAPRSATAPEGDGYLIVCVRDKVNLLTYLVILDATNVKAGPISMVEIPLRLRVSAHGNWVNADTFHARKPLVDYTGVTPDILAEFSTGAPKQFDELDVRPVGIKYKLGPFGPKTA